MCRNKGIALISVLWVAAVLITLVAAFFIQSGVAVKSAQYQEALALAESGVEAARGWAEQNTESGGSLSGQYNTQTVDSSAVTLPVTFKAQAVSGQTAYGSPVFMPVFGSGTTWAQIGYFAFIIQSGPPIQIYAMGAVGSNTSNLLAVRELHVVIKPISYSQYSYFDGNPNDVVGIGDQSRDRITNQFLTGNCNPSCGGLISFTSGQDIPGGNSSLSFNKNYSAGQMVVLPTGNSNNEIITMNQGDYYFSLKDSNNAIYAGQNVYMPSGGNSGIWTGQTSIGLPTSGSTSTTGSLSNVMQSLFNAARSNGLFLYDPRSTWTVNSSTSISSASSNNWNWIPKNSWDPQNNSSSTHGANGYPEAYIYLSTTPVSCFDATGLTTGNIAVYSSNQYMEYYYNGTHGVVYNGSTGWAFASHCFASSALNNKIVYADGNLSIQNYPGSSYSGQMSYVSPGQIAITGNLASKSFLSDSDFTNNTFSSSASDASSLITPYQINLSPWSPNNFKNSMALEQIGSPATLPSPWGGSNSDLNAQANFAITMTGTQFSSHGQYTNIYLYGTQVEYTRQSFWYFYYNNVYQPFDFNLLTVQPPYSPIISAGFNVVLWREVNMQTGADEDYSKP